MKAMTFKNLLLCAASAAMLAACAASAVNTPPAPAPVAAPAPVPAPVKPPAQLGSFGVDLAGRDAAVKPGDDFFEYAGGSWTKANPVPADRSSWGMFAVLREAADANVRKIIEDQAAAKGAPGSNSQKIGDFYASYLDDAAINARGLAPVQPALATIDALKTRDDVARLMGQPDFASESPIAAFVNLDDKNPDRYVVSITHSGLGLPEREYYLKQDAQFKDIRAKYVAHITKMLTLSGDAKAAAHAQSILALETEIAKRHWPIADRREREKTYNPRTLAQLAKEAPGFPWQVYMDSAGTGTESEYIVGEVTAMPALAKLFAATPVATWKPYLAYHHLRAMAAVLPKAFDDEVFDFYGRTLNGQPQQRDRWKRAVAATNGSLGEAIGQIYVAQYFPPNSKAEMDKLVENLRQGYAARIQSVDWMTPETKKVALEKLAAFRPKIGYPGKWKDYSKLDVKAGDAYGNAIRAQLWAYEDQVSRLGKKTDRDEWFMTPQTVNAYYNPTFNEIVFPAAILQPPFFDANADAAVNYGGIGGVIGHEMGHGFDDQGAKSDALGILRTWWSDADVDAFKKRTDSLAAQYDTFEPLPGIKVNGRLTLGENIGDLGGLTVAHKAYELSLGGQASPVIDGVTGDQRFFLGWAQVWRTVYRDQALRNQILTDPHSPGMFRVNGVVRNIDAWYAAFDVKPDNALYLPPEQRVRIW